MRRPRPEGWDRRGFGFGGLAILLAALTTVLIAFKLTGALTWPWLWVLAPIWIPAGLFIGGFTLVIAVGLVYVVILTKLNERCQS